MEITVRELENVDLRGKIIIFPTDTVYGIGCLYDDLFAIDRIYRLKRRDYSKPMAILGADTASLLPLVDVNDRFMEMARTYWPGALTIIVRKTELVSELASAKNSTVGVRIPNHEIALSILRQFGPMVVTSLNQSGEKPIISYRDALNYQNKVDYIVDGGDLSELPSTVYDLETGKVLRQGSLAITE